MWSTTDWPERPSGYDNADIPRSRRRGSFEGIRALTRLPRTAFSAVIVALFAPLGLLAHESVRKFLLIVLVLDIPFAFDIHIGNRENAGDLGSLHGFNISLTTFVLAGLYLPFLVRRRYGAPSVMPRSDASVPLGLYVLFSALSIFAAHDVTLALYEIFLLLQMFLLYFYLVHAVASHDDVLLLIRFLLIGLVLEGFLMMALAGGLAEVNLPGLETRVDHHEVTSLTRVGGTVGSPNEVAAFLGMALGVALAVMLTPLGQRDKALAILGIGAGSSALILTFSRGGWVALAVTLGVLGIAAFRSQRVSRKAWIASLGVLLVIAAFFSEEVASRLAADDLGAAKSRVPLMALAALMIKDHPLLGVGSNNFSMAMEPYVTRGFGGEFLYTVHNKYLLVWTETGIGGIIAFLWFLAATIRFGVRGWKHNDPIFSPLALGCTAALAGCMFHMLVDVFRGRPGIQMVLLFASLLVLLERLAAPRQSDAGWRSAPEDVMPRNYRPLLWSN